MAKSLLTANQQKFLNFFSTQKDLTSLFYFTGGTCLTECYLHHRFSEDLDFFSQEEFDPQDITSLLQSSKKLIGHSKLDYQSSFNRNIYQLIYPSSDILKVEFSYYPFERIDKTNKIGNITIDSLLDIAVNKVFTIHQNPRGRDFYDLYCILNSQKDLNLMELIRLARLKFDSRVDYLQLCGNLMRVKILKDDPIVIKSLDYQIIEDFILTEAKKLKGSIFK